MRGFLLRSLFVYLILAVPAIAQTVNESASVASIRGEKLNIRLAIDSTEPKSVGADLELFNIANDH